MPDSDPVIEAALALERALDAKEERWGSLSLGEASLGAEVVAFLLGVGAPMAPLTDGQREQARRTRERMLRVVGDYRARRTEEPFR